MYVLPATKARHSPASSPVLPSATQSTHVAQPPKQATQLCSLTLKSLAVVAVRHLIYHYFARSHNVSATIQLYSRISSEHGTPFRIQDPRSGGVYSPSETSTFTVERIPGGMYVKRGILVRPTEGQAMRFIDSLISAPIPVVIDNFKLDGITWLVMSRIPGYNLAACYPDMPPEIEDKLSKQLARILAPIRAISPPTSAVCGFDQGPIRCERLAMGAPPLGPFESVEAFHQFLLDRAGTLNIPEQEADEAQAVIKRAHSRSHRICLTHNDLGPHNVIIDEEWNITGIIDWESCAWMPEYWEATKGTYLPQYRKGRWYRIMMAAFPSYRDEFEAEKYIVNYRQWYT